MTVAGGEVNSSSENEDLVELRRPKPTVKEMMPGIQITRKMMVPHLKRSLN
jgi:hypothetical protein